MSFEGSAAARRLDVLGTNHLSGKAEAMPFYVERAWDLKGGRPGVQRERFRRDSPVATLQSWRGNV